MADDLDKIPDHSSLLRRIHPNHVIGEPGARRLSSAAFKDPNMSVDVENMLEASGKDWNFSLRAHPQHWLVRLTAVLMRQNGQSIEHKPVPADPANPLAENPAHAEVAGKKTGAISNAFRHAAIWVKKPADVT
jgi:hypothetical protein